jgi:DNA-binding MarR family transcriptional regulator
MRNRAPIKGPRTLLNSTHDRAVLLFLWEWKISSTQAIAIRFGQKMKNKGHSTYKRLKRLEARGYIRRKADEMAGAWLWALTRKGFLCIAPILPPLREEGFDSEQPRHDRYVMAAHLGNDLERDQNGVRRFTEQQLRRVTKDAYPAWIPSDPSHRPDGYWFLPKQPKGITVALEVELSRKTTEEYAMAGAFYSRNVGVAHVVWLVSQEGHAKAIERAMKSENGSHRAIHSYFLLWEFKDHGWESVCRCGEMIGKRMSDLLETTPRESLGNLLGMSRDTSPIASILDNRTSAFNLDTCDESKNSPVCQ